MLIELVSKLTQMGGLMKFLTKQLPG